MIWPHWKIEKTLLLVTCSASCHCLVRCSLVTGLGHLSWVFLKSEPLHVLSWSYCQTLHVALQQCSSFLPPSSLPPSSQWSDHQVSTQASDSSTPLACGVERRVLGCTKDTLLNPFLKVPKSIFFFFSFPSLGLARLTAIGFHTQSACTWVETEEDLVDSL